MQVCTSFHTDNHANTTPLSFLQAGCPSCRPTNSVKALKVWAILLGDKSWSITQEIIIFKNQTQCTSKSRETQHMLNMLIKYRAWQENTHFIRHSTSGSSLCTVFTVTVIK